MLIFLAAMTIAIATAGLAIGYQKTITLRKLLDSLLNLLKAHKQIIYWTLTIGLILDLLVLAGTPYRYPSLRAEILRLAPLLILAAFWMLWTLFHLRFTPRRRTLEIVFLAVLSVTLLGPYLTWTRTHAIEKNPVRTSSDQGDYLDFTRAVYETGFRYTGSRNRMPAYPFLQAIFFDPDLSNDEAFERGKQINIYLSVVLIFGLFLLTKLRLEMIPAAGFTMVCAFGLFIFKAGYFQAELLYYFNFFVTFLLMVASIKRATLPLGALTGAWAALTYLTKASVAPTLAAFFLVMIGRELISLVRYRKNGDSVHNAIKKSAPTLTVVPGFIVCFLLVLSPYLLQNKQIYGRFFYNVNSTFYVWYDNWDQAKAGTRAAGDRSGWPDMPAEEIPTMRKYLAEHSANDILVRLQVGLASQFEVLRNPYGGFNYPLILLLSWLIISALTWPDWLDQFHKNTAPIVFFILFFSLNLISIAWFAPIADYSVTRLTFTLYLPFCFSMYYSISKTAQRPILSLPVNLKVNGNKLLTGAGVLLIGLVLLDVLFFVQPALRAGYFGK